MSYKIRSKKHLRILCKERKIKFLWNDKATHVSKASKKDMRTTLKEYDRLVELDKEEVYGQESHPYYSRGLYFSQPKSNFDIIGIHRRHYKEIRKG